MMINKSLKILLGLILVLIILNILVTILDRSNTNSTIRKLESVEQRLDTAHMAIENARYQIDTLLTRTHESEKILHELNQQVRDINRKYQQEQKTSRQKIEKLKKQNEQNQEKLQELQKELKPIK